MVVVALLMGLLAFPVAARADDEAKREAPVLTVTGSGRLAVEPDTAFVTFGMETAGKSLAEAQRLNNQVMQKVTARLRELQIEKERIQTSSFTVSPQYKPPPKRPADAPPAPPEIIGYVVSNSVTVEVRNTEKVAPVIEESLAAGANHFQGLHWALRDEQQAKLGALRQAAARAREKATALSEALHVKLVRLTGVNEASHVVRPASHVSRAMMAMDGGNEPPVFSGEMTVEATVTLTYEIGPE
ncbi:MAG TPA: SIMPL domain-containing protein [Nitrospira sp.]|nr:SIMPL domain-containing protein [Nitrospira sp.]